MKLASYNIQYGFGADGRYDLARAAAVVADADIIALQEVERHWRRSHEDDQPALLGAMLPDHFWVYGPAFDMDASQSEAGSQPGEKRSRRRQFGTMLLSRWPIEWSRLHCLPMRKTLIPLNTRNAALEGLIRTPLGPIRLVSLHLAHIGREERLEQIDFLLDRHRAAVHQGGPWSGADDEPLRDWTEGQAEPDCPATAIWMGDFNCEPGSDEYLRITGQTPYHPGARYAGGLVDAAVAAGQDPDGFFTHSKEIGGTLRHRRLDYCFVDAGLASRVSGYRVGTDAKGSDHLPVFVEIDTEKLAPSRHAAARS